MISSNKPPNNQPLLSSHVARSAVLVALFLAADKLLGVVREAAVGRAFGTSAVLDAYFVAFEVPEGLNTIVTGAALTTALIPLLTSIITRAGHKDAPAQDNVWRFISAVINWILIIVGVASIFAAVLARPIIVTVAPGFADNPAQVALAVRLMRLVLIQTLIFSASTVVTGTLQAHHHFLLPALAPLCYTLGRIFGIVVLAPSLGIFGLAWGGLAGAVAHLLIKLPWLVRRRARWTLTLFHPRLPDLLRLMAPRMLGMGVTYVSFVLPTTFGSQLPDGSISAYEYAWKLMQLPETVLGTAMGIVVFPTLARIAEQNDREGLRRTFSWALRLIMALSIPAAVGLLVLGRTLTALVFQRGAFDAAATERVYWALQFFALGLVAHSALEMVARLFYAQRDMWTPFWAALGGLALNATLGWTLLPQLAHGSMALSNSLGTGFQVIFLLLVAHWRLGGVGGRVLGASLARTGLAATLMGAAVLGFRALLPDVGLLVTGAGGLVIGAGTYILAALLLGSEEIRDLPGLLLRRE
ncbi:MAG: murein biosynthesis integral membrane protein MurJ [Chloroflexi bacterium]|nr:murein biosynthesis integral membrane protein MurJ [Chloroflexota bacterium]